VVRAIDESKAVASHAHSKAFGFGGESLAKIRGVTRGGESSLLLG
jgi:hypothetical protein